MPTSADGPHSRVGFIRLECLNGELNRTAAAPALPERAQHDSPASHKMSTLPVYFQGLNSALHRDAELRLRSQSSFDLGCLSGGPGDRVSITTRWADSDLKNLMTRNRDCDSTAEAFVEIAIETIPHPEKQVRTFVGDRYIEASLDATPEVRKITRHDCQSAEP